jgi:hypothetical protein
MKPEIKINLELNSDDYFDDIEDILQSFVKKLQLNILFSRYEITTFSFSSDTKQININLQSN